MSSELELLSIGDASLDVFVTPTESETHCRVDDKECFYAFPMVIKFQLSH